MHVVHGPAMPRLDETLSPRPFEVPRGATRVVVDRDADALAAVDALLAALPDLGLDLAVSPPELEVTVHEDDGGAPRVIFVMNPTKEAVRARLSRSGAWAPAEPGEQWELEDVMSGETFSFGADVSIELAGASLRMLRVVSGPFEAVREELGRAG
jgi:hypothetical protein